MYWLKAIRLPNLLIVVATQLLIKYGVIERYIPDAEHFPDKFFALLVFATLCLTVFGYLINDYYDYELDRSTDRKFHAPIKKNEILAASIFVCLIGFMVSMHIAYKVDLLKMIWIYPVASIALLIYSMTLKSQGIAGNILVSAFTAFVIGIVMLAETHIDFKLHNSVHTLLISFMIFAFLVNLYREIIKDLEDQKEDEAFGLTTLPVRIGSERAKLTAFFIAVLALILVIIFSLNVPRDWFERMHLFVGICVPFLWILFLNLKAQESSDYKLISILVKMTMLLGLFYLLH